MTSTLSARQGALTRAINRLSTHLNDSEDVITTQIEPQYEDNQLTYISTLQKIVDAKLDIQLEMNNVQIALDNYNAAADHLDQNILLLYEIRKIIDAVTEKTLDLLDKAARYHTKLSKISITLEGRQPNVTNSTVAGPTTTNFPSVSIPKFKTVNSYCLPTPTYPAFLPIITQEVMANQLSQAQCLSPRSHRQQLSAFNQPLAYMPLQHGSASVTQHRSISSSTLMPTSTTHPSPHPLLNTASPSSDSVFSVSTSLNSLPSECRARRSDVEVKMEIPDGDEADDFFELEKHQKARSASFDGSTQYSSQLITARQSLFAPYLDTIGNVASRLYDSGENLNSRLGDTSVTSTDLLHISDGINFSLSSCKMPSSVMSGSGGGDKLARSGGSGANDGIAGDGSAERAICLSKKSTTKRRVWGSFTYADLITQAIVQSPEKRLTLAQVYEWMVENVPVFRDKGDSNGLVGWKNSIRYNLSLYSRFMRIQNEGVGKSWWVINPDAKLGRSLRRVHASTLDTTSKARLPRKLKKRIDDVYAVGGLRSGVYSLAGSQTSVMSHDICSGDDAMQTSYDSMFRPRTPSNLSVLGSSTRALSPIEHPFDDFDFRSWVNDATAASTAAASGGGKPYRTSATAISTDIIDKTDQIRIDSCRATLNGVKQQESKPNIKTESSVVQPHSYLKLSSVRKPF